MPKTICADPGSSNARRSCAVLQIGADLAVQAREAGLRSGRPSRTAPTATGTGSAPSWRGGLPFVMPHKPRRGAWAHGADAHTPVDAARDLTWGGPDDPGDRHEVTRAFRQVKDELGWADF